MCGFWSEAHRGAKIAISQKRLVFEQNGALSTDSGILYYDDSSIDDNVALLFVMNRINIAVSQWHSSLFGVKLYCDIDMNTAAKTR
jgi:hypothetical protein